MIYFYILLITLTKFPVYRSVNIQNSTQKVKNVLENYNQVRCTRCVDLRSNLSRFFEKSMNLFEKSDSFGTFLQSVDCDGAPSERRESLFNKEYFSPRHEMAALEKWRQNLQKVVQHNMEYLAGKQTYTLHLNLFGDMHVTDYFRKILKLIKTVPLFDPAEDVHRTAYRHKSYRTIPSKMDWRQRGFKPRLEEQWQCGACYAFAVTHATQAQLFMRRGDWRELSPQQIVDCSIVDGNRGCAGGSLRAALRYVARAGLVPERLYPYTGKRGHCQYSPLLVAARPHRWAALPQNEAAIERALSTIGPLPVGINAAPFTFQLYRSGIYDDPFCVSWTLNHAMLLVGFTEEYWILLNWWGSSWGEKGYMRIRRGFNRCGISNMAMYIEL